MEINLINSDSSFTTVFCEKYLNIILEILEVEHLADR